MKKGFTLAEVLITLGIIGVVASLTMPTLIQNYQEKATVVKLKKIYSMLSQAYQSASMENGDPTNWGLKDTPDATYEGSRNLYNILIQPYFNVIKYCDVQPGCFYSQNPRALPGDEWHENFDTNKRIKFVLNDGIIMMVSSYSSKCSYDDGNHIRDPFCGIVVLDINGKKLPNTWGRDIFSFLITKDSILPDGINKTMPNLSTTNSSFVFGWTTGWVIQNENMDYLHCNDLSWNSKTKCK
ncbi:MAG: type II secretion system GspH family protein [Heliobacteriaceae bacterium]|jgi:prepilin-type N-terminal cleavage/methylation domain-containing protein|nr:type II secretion system GspH family protein [Heliobacteriaceae bacterium]